LKCLQPPTHAVIQITPDCGNEHDYHVSATTAGYLDFPLSAFSWATLRISASHAGDGWKQVHWALDSLGRLISIAAVFVLGGRLLLEWVYSSIPILVPSAEIHHDRW
jgi:hypothetical protein